MFTGLALKPASPVLLLPRTQCIVHRSCALWTMHDLEKGGPSMAEQFAIEVDDLAAFSLGRDVGIGGYVEE